SKKVKIDTLSAGTQITVDKKFKVWVRVKINEEIRFIRPAPFKALCKIQAPEVEPKPKEEAEPEPEPAPEPQAPSDAKNEDQPAKAPAPKEAPQKTTEEAKDEAVSESIVATEPPAPTEQSAAASASVTIPSTPEPQSEPPKEQAPTPEEPAVEIIAPQADPETAAVPLVNAPVEGIETVLPPECECKEDLPQDPRDGAYFGLGFGLGGADFLKAAVANGSAVQVNMRFGYAFSSQWLLGARMQLINQFSQWKENKPISAGISTILLDTQIFPLADLGFNIELAGGWTSVAKFKRLTDIEKTTLPTISSLTGEGPAYAFALGYDFASETNAVFGLSARYDGAAPKDINPIHGGSLNFSLNWY
ncbi:MAG: hypothetical protein CMH60_05505, partial [Myxococcales bacterium]|nr:hypothetical protein [Myxococcales bacterium]